MYSKHDLYVKVKRLLAYYLSKYSKGVPSGLLSFDRSKMKTHLEREIAYINLHLDRYVEILSRIETQHFPKELKVLDIGTASGHLAFLVKSLFNYEVSAIDLKRDETPYWRYRLTNEGITYKICDLTKDTIPFEDECFDLILFCEVLEHITTHPMKVFRKIWRVHRKGGILIMSTPNLLRLPARIRFLFGKNPLSVKHVKGKAAEHFRLYSADEIESLIQNSGFQVEKLYFYTPSIYSKKYLKRALHMIAYLIVKIHSSLGTYIICQAKKPHPS
ncbi:MAG: class I SAM-dependent methyltransferase [Candidatus Bathyarchaeota archaeon]|nr:class I SAM-dependent methyltransferase [Candidatus Bathyarchaeota archaeon]